MASTNAAPKQRLSRPTPTSNARARANLRNVQARQIPPKPPLISSHHAVDPTNLNNAAAPLNARDVKVESKNKRPPEMELLGVLQWIEESCKTSDYSYFREQVGKGVHILHMVDSTGARHKAMTFTKKCTTIHSITPTPGMSPDVQNRMMSKNETDGLAATLIQWGGDISLKSTDPEAELRYAKRARALAETGVLFNARGAPITETTILINGRTLSQIIGTQAPNADAAAKKAMVFRQGPAQSSTRPAAQDLVFRQGPAARRPGPPAQRLQPITLKAA